MMQLTQMSTIYWGIKEYPDTPSVPVVRLAEAVQPKNNSLVSFVRIHWFGTLAETYIEQTRKLIFNYE